MDEKLRAEIQKIMDNNRASNEKIKDITIFSKENNCSIYFKIKNYIILLTY